MTRYRLSMSVYSGVTNDQSHLTKRQREQEQDNSDTNTISSIVFLLNRHLYTFHTSNGVSCYHFFTRLYFVLSLRSTCGRTTFTLAPSGSVSSTWRPYSSCSACASTARGSSPNACVWRPGSGRIRRRANRDVAKGLATTTPWRSGEFLSPGDYHALKEWWVP